MSVLKSVLPKAWDLPDVFKSRMGEEVGRQRLMQDNGHFLVILHAVPKAEDKGSREAALFWMDAGGSWKSMPDRGGKAALREHVESYQNRIKQLDDELERATSAAAIHEVIDQASPILRSSRNMLAVLQELRTGLADDRAVLAIRDLAVSVERSAELLVLDGKTSLDFLIAKSSTEQAAEAAKATAEARKLNRMAAFFFPLMTLAAVFGMNRPSDMLSSGGVWMVLLAGLILGAVVGKRFKN